MRSMGRNLGRLPKFEVIPSELYGKHCKNNWKSLYHPMWVLMSVIYFCTENVAVEFLQHFLPLGLVNLQDSFGLYIFQISTADLILYRLFFLNVYQNSSILSHQPALWSTQLSKPQTLHSAPRFKDLVTVNRKKHFGGQYYHVSYFQNSNAFWSKPLYHISCLMIPITWITTLCQWGKVHRGDPVRVKPPSLKYGINEKWSDLREILNKESTVLDDRLETKYET